jgi:hypothetical protein
MARETAAQRNARFDAEREARRQAEMAAYPSRLMSTLARVNNQYDWTLTVVDEVFLVSNPSSRAYHNKEYRMAYAFDTVSQENLEDLEYMLNDLEEAQAEAKRQSSVKAEAQRKVRELLNDEERALLGLQ